MARGVNKVILIGNLGGDPEVRYTQEGKAVASLSLATSSVWKDKEGVVQERAEWHRLVFFSRLAEIAGEYLKKGSKIYVEGSLRTREWDDKQGQKHYTTEVVVSEMQMLDGKGAGVPRTSSGVGASVSVDRRGESSVGPVQSGGDHHFDDDIPF